MPFYTHKGVRASDKRPHKHPSHPYRHPRGRKHVNPPTSRIRDRKGKKFRQTAAEKRRKRVKKTYKPRRGKRKRWDQPKHEGI